MYMYLLIYPLYFYLSIYRPIHLPIFLSMVLHIYLCVYLSLDSSFRVSCWTLSMRWQPQQQRFNPLFCQVIKLIFFCFFKSSQVIKSTFQNQVVKQTLLPESSCNSQSQVIKLTFLAESGSLTDYSPKVR